MINPELLRIKNMVATDANWTERAIIAIYSRNQTSKEQVDQRTEIHNGIGFSAVDGEILSSFAVWLMKSKFNRLSQKQLACAQKMMPKYAGQLCDLAGIPRTVKKNKGVAA